MKFTVILIAFFICPIGHIEICVLATLIDMRGKAEHSWTIVRIAKSRRKPRLGNTESRNVLFLQGKNALYYWREYTGEIPNDAVPGGLDLNQKDTYIGHGFVSNAGIIPGIIYQDQKNLSVPEHGAKTLDTYIMILCSPYKYAFKWYPVTATNFKIETIGKYLVKGGMEQNNLLNIGRISFQGEVVTGKVVTNSHDYQDIAPMFFVHKNQEHKTSEYEVLVFDIANMLQWRR